MEDVFCSCLGYSLQKKIFLNLFLLSDSQYHWIESLEVVSTYSISLSHQHSRKIKYE